MTFIFREPITPIKAQEPDPLASDVDDIAEGRQTDELLALFLLALIAQYESTDIRRVIRESGLQSLFRENGIEALDNLPSWALSGLVEENTDPIADHLDSREVIAILNIVGNLGIDAGTAQGNRDLTGQERVQVQTDVQEGINARVLSLLGLLNPRGLAPTDIENMTIPQGLDATSYERISSLLLQAIRQAESEGRLTQRRIIEIYNDLVEPSVETRAQLIAEDNTTTVYGNALFTTVAVFQPRTKTWLRTRSASPRPDHLAQVGVTVPFDETFPTGNFWSQEEIGCKCGVRVGF